MSQNKTYNYFPLGKLLRLLFFLSLGLQFIVVSQMYFYKADFLNDPAVLLVRIFRGIILTFLAGLILSYPILTLIQFLNRKMPWKKYMVKRFFLQFSFGIAAGLLVTPLILVPAGLIFKMEFDVLVILNNSYYLIILCIFLMTVMEARIYFEESSVSKIRAEEIQKELLLEASNKSLAEAKVQIEEEKNRYAQLLIEKEKLLNQNLEKEIRRREEVSNHLNESREQLHSIMSNLVGAAYRCKFDDNYSVEYFSEKLYSISGYPPSDFTNNAVRSFASIIYPDDLEICRNNISEAAKNKSAYEFEYRIIHLNGNIVWVKENGKCIFDSQGQVVYLDGIIIDITRSKEAEIAATESQKNYKELMDFLPQPIFELDLEGRIVFTNKAGDDFFGILPEDPKKHVSALDFFVTEDIPKIIENFKKSAQGIKTEASEFTAIKKDGSHCPVMVFGTPIIRNDKIVGRRGIIIDISERKKYEIGLINAKNELEQINSTLEQSVAERTRQLTHANTQLLKVQKENLQSQFEVLKQQVNPHFLFNSLNVLTSLIKIDPDLAESFTERLSKVYRYVLENKEKDVVSLSTELEFLNAYLFLLEIRFMKKIIIEINIDKLYYDFQILPIAIQLVIENAIKHNTFSKLNPLKIEIFVDEQQKLNIVNNLNIRETKFASTGVGLENISRRYALVSDQNPEFIKTNEHFIARLPLLRSEKFETEKK